MAYTLKQAQPRPLQNEYWNQRNIWSDTMGTGRRPEGPQPAGPPEPTIVISSDPNRQARPGERIVPLRTEAEARSDESVSQQGLGFDIREMLPNRPLTLKDRQEWEKLVIKKIGYDWHEIDVYEKASEAGDPGTAEFKNEFDKWTYKKAKGKAFWDEHMAFFNAMEQVQTQDLKKKNEQIQTKKKYAINQTPIIYGQLAKIRKDYGIAGNDISTLPPEASNQWNALMDELDSLAPFLPQGKETQKTEADLTPEGFETAKVKAQARQAKTAPEGKPGKAKLPVPIETLANIVKTDGPKALGDFFKAKGYSFEETVKLAQEVGNFLRSKEGAKGIRKPRLLKSVRKPGEIPERPPLSTQPRKAGPFVELPSEAVMEELTDFANKTGLGAESWKAAAKLLANMGGFAADEFYIKPLNEVKRLIKRYLEVQKGARERLPAYRK